MDIRIKQDINAMCKLDGALTEFRVRYEKLPWFKQELLNHLLKVYVICNHLLGVTLPGTWCNKLQMHNTEIPIERALLAVKQWHKKDTYTPEPADDYSADENYPVSKAETCCDEHELVSLLLQKLDAPLAVSLIDTVLDEQHILEPKIADSCD